MQNVSIRTMNQRHHEAATLRVLFGGLLAGLILTAASPSAVAQRPDANEDDDDGPTALSVGNLSSDFTFGGSGGYNYDGGPGPSWSPGQTVR